MFQSDPSGRFIVSAAEAAGSLDATCNGIAVFSTVDWSIVGGSNITPMSVGILKNGREIIVGSADGGVTLVDVRGIQPDLHVQAYEEVKFGNTAVVGVAGSPDGRYFLAAAHIGIINGAYVDDPDAMEWSKKLLPIRILRASDGQCVASFIPPFEVERIAWDPKGRYVVFADFEHHLVIWRPFSPRLSYSEIESPSNGFAIAISPDGNSIAATTDSGVIVLNLNDHI
jgi:WD40 repeat protein